MTTPLAIVLTIYLVGIFALSIVAARRVKSEEDFIVAGRRLPLWLAWGTLLATWFGAATVLGAAEAARGEGLRGTLLDPFASGLALIVAGLFFARRLWDMKLLTIADFYGRVFGPRAEMLASVILVPGYFGWIGAQYVALAGLQQTFFGVPAWAGILLAAGVVLLYTLVGGMWSVTLTDTLQLAVIFVTLAVMAGVTLAHLGSGSQFAGLSRLLRETPADRLTLLPAASAAAMIAWTATLASGIFGNIPGQDLTQRIFASRDAVTARRACILAGMAYILFGLLPVGMGLASNILVPHAAGNIVGILAQEYLTPTLAAIFVVALVSVIVSTATSAVLAPACILAHNIIGRLRPQSALRGEGRKLLIDRLSVLAITAGGVIAAFSGKTILDLLELSLSIVVVTLFVSLVSGLYGGVRSDRIHAVPAAAGGRVDPLNRVTTNRGSRPLTLDPRPSRERAAMWSMGAGLVVWLARELMEGVWLPLSDAAAEAGVSYAEFVAQNYPAAEVGAWLSAALYAFALFPSAISGTAASAAAYLIAGRGATRREG